MNVCLKTKFATHHCVFAFDQAILRNLKKNSRCRELTRLTPRRNEVLSNAGTLPRRDD